MKTALVIDDSTTVRLYHRHLLESQGFEVTEAQNGVEGLERVAERRFDLLLVDVNMPQMDGYRFLAELRQTEAGSTPAIMVTTEAQAADSERAFAAGANLHLTKPLRPDDFGAYVALMVEEPAP